MTGRFLLLRSLARRWIEKEPADADPAKIPPARKMHTTWAICICISSALMGAIAVRNGWTNTSQMAMDVGMIWASVGAYLDGFFTRAHWRTLAMPLSRIYQHAKQGKLPKSSPLVSVMQFGGGILFTIGFILQIREGF